jgi:hypothetical protein
MKAFFFFVVLANVAFFMWEYHRNATQQVTERTQTPDVPVQESIELVDELNGHPPAGRETAAAAEFAGRQDAGSGAGQNRAENREMTDFANEGRAPFNAGRLSAGAGSEVRRDESASATGEKSAAEAARAEEQICIEAGPFSDLKLLNEWRSQLSAVNAQLRIQARPGQVVGDYLVYQPAAETPEQSDADLKMLKSLGFTDVWKMTEGEEKDGIALGVFKKEEKAVVLKEQMRAKGIDAEVMPRYRKQEQQYVLVKGEGHVTERLALLQEKYPGISLKPTASCDEP